MDGQSSLIPAYDPSKVSPLRFCSLLLPAEQYATQVINFPAANCTERWGLKGDFFLSCLVYQEGKLSGSIETAHCNEQGYLEVDFATLRSGLRADQPGLVIAEFFHTNEIPVEIYFSHIHQETGNYMSYPALPFMGDLIYLDVHVEQLENTLFWPGVTVSEERDVCPIILNPYTVPFSYQLSLYLPSGKTVQSKIFKIRPHQVKQHSIKETFAENYQEIVESGGQSSLCLAAQYKVIAYVAIKDAKLNCFTTIDHLHTYTLY